MVEVYCKLIIGKRRAFDKVPENFKMEVEARLKELGYDTNGDKLTVEHESNSANTAAEV